jgi:hypothetical protein
VQDTQRKQHKEQRRQVHNHNTTGTATTIHNAYVWNKQTNVTSNVKQ